MAIELRREPNDQVLLIVQDDGVGLPPAFSLEHTTSLGLRLVEALVSQLNGSLELDRTGGTTFTIRFVSLSPKAASWYTEPEDAAPPMADIFPLSSEPNGTR